MIYATQDIVYTMPLAEKSSKGTVRLIVKLTEHALGPDIGITLHQNVKATPWNDAISLCMFDFIKNTNGGVHLAGYNTDVWDWHQHVKVVERNRMIALWLTYDAEMNTHSLSAQLQGETAVSEVFSNYGDRASNRNQPNEYVGFCSIFVNDKDGQTTDAIEIIEKATLVDSIQPYVFNDTTCYKSYSDVIALEIPSGESHLFNNQQLTTSGIYYDTLVNVQGCDSIVTLNLTVVPNTEKARVLALLQKVNNYYMHQNPETETTSSGESKWLEGSYFIGHMALFKLHPTTEIMRYAMQWAQNNSWNIGNTPGEADNQCVGQVYMDLYYANGAQDHSMLEKVGLSVKNMVDRSSSIDDWHWVDALYMAMPTLTRYGIYEKNNGYFDKLYQMYTDTKVSRKLYNTNDSLWYRDSGVLSGSKYKCYWSRGNGWAFGAHVNILKYLPTTDAHRQEYIDTYKAMAYKLIQLQQTDGFWNSCLDDKTYYPGLETSGTAFFVYGLAWGINQGIIDKDIFLPTVMKGWNALVEKAMDSNGRIGYVQGVADEPKDNQPVLFEHSREYGYGNFLLAGTEVVHLVEGELPIPSDFYVKDVELLEHNQMEITFFEPVDKTTVEMINNYTISNGVVVLSSVISSDSLHCILTLGTIKKGDYSISFENIKSHSGKMIAPNGGHYFKVNESMISSIQSVKNKQAAISLYPNPVSNRYFKVHCTDCCPRSLIISIFDSTGKLIKTRIIERDSNIFSVDTEGFSTGLYLLKIHAPDFCFSRTVMIQ